MAGVEREKITKKKIKKTLLREGAVSQDTGVTRIVKRMKVQIRFVP